MSGNPITQRQSMARGSKTPGYGSAAEPGSSLKRFAKGGTVKGMDGKLGKASGLHKSNGHHHGFGGVRSATGSSGAPSSGSKGPSKQQFGSGTHKGGSLRQKW